jgi:D-alanyl-lipoteichoic acid acyltransferase DltB (MBOAT superfamily)
MSFHSLEYAIFFTIVFLVFWGLHRFGMAKVLFIIAASWFFYAASNPWFLVILLCSTVVDYVVALRLDAEDDPRRRKAWLLLSIASNLGLLSVFKYANFFKETAVAIGGLFGSDATFQAWDIVLPAGISFYTFMSLSYTVDVYKRQMPVERSFLRFSFFIAFFPHLVAGPILRASNFLPQIHRTSFVSRLQASRALWLIALGIVKKVVIADVLATNVVERVWADPSLVSSADVLVGLYAFTAHIYLDFSAYSDIAIGSALLLGFHLPDNFDRPYQATTCSEFWRRWHMTMSSFLRDYVYYPLGGSRGSEFKVYRNLFITFLLIGLWHGANWNFAIYGAGNAIAVCVNRWVRKRRGDRELELDTWGVLWRVFLTFNFVVFMRILFKSAAPGTSSDEALHKAGDIVSRLFDGQYGHVTVMTTWLWILLIGSFVVHWTPRRWVEGTWLWFRRLPLVWQGAIVAAMALVIAATADGRPLPPVYQAF